MQIPSPSPAPSRRGRTLIWTLAVLWSGISLTSWSWNQSRVNQCRPGAAAVLNPRPADRNQQGYHEDQVSGVANASVSMANYREAVGRVAWSVGLSHCLLWALGLLGIVLGGSWLLGQSLRRADAVRELEESEERLWVIASSTPDHVLVQDRELRYLFVMNPQLGLTERDMIGKTDYDFLSKEDADSLARIKKEVLETAKTVHVEIPLTSPNGEHEYFDGTYLAKRGANGRVDGLIGYFRNVTDKKRAETLLRRSEERFHTLYVNMAEGVAIHELVRDELGTPINYRLIDVNPAYAQNVGLNAEQVVGKLATEAYRSKEPPYLREFATTAETGIPCRFEAYFQPLNKHFSISVVPMGDKGFATIFLDVSERKRTEEELARHRDGLEELVKQRTSELEESRATLRRAERLASIGTLAAGIAHEINNPLGMMLLASEMALRSLDKPEALQALLRQQKNDAERCARIVKSVLDFSRRRSTEKCPLDLNEAVRCGIDFTQEFARTHGVTLEAHLTDALDAVLGHMTELEQLVVNLVHNAVQACKAGGHVVVETQVADDKIRLTIHDDGCGMSTREQEHVFDPFYTTRVEKGGTGLGLSVVHGIVTRHGGTIGVSSALNGGTTFTMEFPRYSEQQA